MAILVVGKIGLTYDEIAEEFGCDRRTAERMANALSETFPHAERHTDVETDNLVRWRLPQKSISHLVAPTAEEFAALTLAITTLEQTQSSNESKHLRSVKAKLSALVPSNESTRLETDEDALLQAMGRALRPGPRSIANDSIGQDIADALKGPFHLKILYGSRSDQSPRYRTLEPYGLLLGTRRYLLGKDTSKNSRVIRRYRIEDIDEAEVLETSFEIDTDFDLNDYAARAFGSYDDEDQFGKVHWVFSKAAAPHAKRYLFHSSQQTVERADGSLEVTFSASGYLEMCWHLYQWGDQVEVLAPKELVEMVKGYQRSDFAGLP